MTHNALGASAPGDVQSTSLFNAVERKGISNMEQNTDQTQLLQSLYQEYLTQSIQLREQLLQANLTIQALEAQLATDGETSEDA